ncbi:hypothetical protein N3K66_007281 [Trichothecium roseum]|uniref:Uncharacterized protein n=1 Tax=Trichothecium roseum TaxID=47278 RepID=A0ACC0UTG6_9HYPO|nr:hypothetical protein N3K66_007281 [Trichothecium roseum]
MPDGRLQKSTGYSTHPPTVRVRRRLANLPPEQQKREKARRHEYNAIWNMCARTSKKKEYEKAAIGTKRNMLLAAAKSLMARRVKNGSVICGIDLDEMVQRHLNKEAEQRAVGRGKKAKINLKGVAVDSRGVGSGYNEEVDDYEEMKEPMSPFNMLLAENNQGSMPPEYDEDGEDEKPTRIPRGLFPGSRSDNYRYKRDSSEPVAAEEQLQVINERLLALLERPLEIHPPFIEEQLAAVQLEVQKCHAKLNMIIGAAAYRQPSDTPDLNGPQQFYAASVMPGSVSLNEPTPSIGTDSPFHVLSCPNTGLGDRGQGYQTAVDPQLFNALPSHPNAHSQLHSVDRGHSATPMFSNSPVHTPGPRRRWATPAVGDPMGGPFGPANMAPGKWQPPLAKTPFTPLAQKTHSNDSPQTCNYTNAPSGFATEECRGAGVATHRGQTGETSRPGSSNFITTSFVPSNKLPSAGADAAASRGHDGTGGTRAYQVPTVHEDHDDMAF